MESMHARDREPTVERTEGRMAEPPPGPAGTGMRGEPSTGRPEPDDPGGSDDTGPGAADNTPGAADETRPGTTRDVVDDATEDSFPASDAPAWPSASTSPVWPADRPIAAPRPDEDGGGEGGEDEREGRSRR